MDLDGEAILKQVDRNMAPVDYEMRAQLINIEPSGECEEFALRMLKRGRDKVVAHFLSAERGTARAALRLGSQIWLHTVGAREPLPITGLQSAVGGVFNNADILRLDYSDEYRVRFAEEEGHDYMLSLDARDESVPYHRLTMWVDRNTLVPAKVEAYAASGALLKTVYYRNVEDFGEGLIRPSVLETDSPLHEGHKSMLVLTEIQPRRTADEVFTLEYLPRIGQLQ